MGMAENEPAFEGESDRIVPPRRQSSRIQNKKRAEKELRPKHVDEEKNVRETTRNESNATAREIVEAVGVGVAPKKEARTKDAGNIARKELLAHRRVELLDDDGEGSAPKRRKENAECGNEAIMEEQNAESSAYAVEKKDNVADDANGEVHDCGEVGNGLFSVVDDVAEKSAYANVKEILRLFNKYYLQFVESGHSIV